MSQVIRLARHKRFQSEPVTDHRMALISDRGHLFPRSSEPKSGTLRSILDELVIIKPVPISVRNRRVE